MAVFCGEFALILLVSGSRENLSQLTAHEELPSGTGLNAWVRKTGERKVEHSVRYQLHAACMDHPGVVYELSRILSGLGINIESMETDLSSSGE